MLARAWSCSINTASYQAAPLMERVKLLFQFDKQ